MNDMEKLPVLLEHWLEHNAAHEAEFERWARRAREAGLPEVAGHIAGAANRAREAADCLRQARSRLDGGGRRDVPE